MTRSMTRSMTGFAETAHMEWIKLRSVQSTGWILVLFAVSMTGLAVLALGVQTPAHMDPSEVPSFDPTEQGFVDNLVVAQLLTGLLGTLVICGEFSSGLIRATFAAVPRRPLLLAAKAAVLAAVTLAVGEVLAFAAFFAGQAALYSGLPHAGLGQLDVVRAVLMAGAYPCLISLTGLGISAIVRHTAAAVSTLVGVLFVLPLVLFPLPHSAAIEKFLPMPIAANSLVAVKPIAGSLGPWQGLAILCVYAAAALVGGFWALTRRDV